jgi:hypothetical protein
MTVLDPNEALEISILTNSNIFSFTNQFDHNFIQYNIHTI